MRNPSRLAGLRLGVGLDGFIDWIVMHQILQWHHLLTATGDQPATTIDGLEANTLADGLFYLATWVIVLAATTVTVRAWRDGRLAPPWRVHVGMLHPDARGVFQQADFIFRSSGPRASHSSCSWSSAASYARSRGSEPARWGRRTLELDPPGGPRVGGRGGVPGMGKRGEA